MNGEIERHRKMVEFLAERTGLEAERIEKICYAGEPWTEFEQLSRSLSQTIQYVKDTGSPPRVIFDAIHALRQLESELHDAQTKGSLQSPSRRLVKKIGDVSRISRESPETVTAVITAMIQFFNSLVEKARRDLGNTGKSF